MGEKRLKDKKEKGKKRSPWFDVFDEIKKLEKMMDELIKNIENSNKYARRYRSPYGFSKTFNRSKKPANRGFRRYIKEYVSSELKDQYEPLIDVFNEKDKIRIVAEVLGAKKEDVDIYVTKESLTISVHNENVKFYKEIALPAKVDPKTAVARYKNGVLEIYLKKTKGKSLFGGQKIFVK
mgnify:CR=1 FL=1